MLYGYAKGEHLRAREGGDGGDPEKAGEGEGERRGHKGVRLERVRGGRGREEEGGALAR